MRVRDWRGFLEVLFAAQSVRAALASSNKMLIVEVFSAVCDEAHESIVISNFFGIKYYGVLK